MPRYCLIFENFMERVKKAAYMQIFCDQVSVPTKLQVGIPMGAIGTFGVGGKCLVAIKYNFLSKLPANLSRTQK